MLSARSKKLLVTLTLLLYGLPAFASNALNAMEGIAIFIGLLVAGVGTFISFLFAMMNRKRNSRASRAIAIIFSLPLLLFAFFSFTFSVLYALVSFAVLILLWLLIYKTWRTADA